MCIRDRPNATNPSFKNAKIICFKRSGNVFCIFSALLKDYVDFQSFGFACSHPPLENLNGDNRQNGLDLFDLRAFLAIYSTQAKKIAKLAKQVNGMANRMHRIAL